MPSYPFHQVRDKFQFLSLQTTPEVIEALCHVREECGKVADMNLFHTGGGKHLRLEEFDQAQNQATTQVQAHTHLHINSHIHSLPCTHTHTKYTCTHTCVHIHAHW